MKNNSSQNQKIVIPCSDLYEFVKLSDIIRCEGFNNKCRVYLTNGKILLSTLTIGGLKRGLTAYNFYACHKSHVINVDHIERYSKEGYVEMTDQSTVPVSRRNKEEFLTKVISDYNICAPRGSVRMQVENSSELDKKNITEH